ncbi:hypothetical protein ORI89_08315 [Sphingobacterium sp. UT-1RO-CII-1]|uniref:hypothetical protein n=1 Tax=Sphingobacterium sp. UT-1RO-CII-1 TaxID=2995225 RepID=UPI00227A7660|nr:hypothetical protein [Sphingobacterium sp. UT-1RO-CII-1]MCY4779653.1 hypothetical protein [Sphingobacterium sp. UT-1RO-CII-1]
MSVNVRLKPPKKSDELLKAIFEENFPDFLRFMYEGADDIFDLDRGLTFMDKELLEITPERGRKKGKRIADLLVKVFLKDGTEKWILLHTEIEGSNNGNFAQRVFQYYYRLFDRYGVPVETIAVFTGECKQSRPDQYSYEGYRTRVYFHYLSYQIFDHHEDELLGMDNIFAYIVFFCQKALQENKIPEEELSEQRSTIARALIEINKYSKDLIMSFLVFLKNFLFIRDKDLNSNFDQYIYQVTGGTIEMGVIETIKKQEREKGIKTGIRTGIEKGKIEGKIELLKELGYSIVDVCKKLSLTEEQVKPYFTEA